MPFKFQDLEEFKVPPGFRGRSGPIVLLWQIVQATLFGLSPQPMYGWRRFLLRVFGAKIGRKVLIRPTARITFPWKVRIGDNSWIGDHVQLYSLSNISIGVSSVISQRCYICTASHNAENVSFPFSVSSINIADQVWLATDVFIAPGVTIEKGAVVGARSSVFKNIPSGVVAFGSPAKIIRKRRSHGLGND